MLDTDACDDVTLGQGATKRANMKAISRVLHHNYGIVLASAMFIIGTIVVLIVLVYMAHKTVSNYYRFMIDRKTRDVKMARRGEFDDEQYEAQTDREKHERNQRRDEYSSIRSRIQQLKSMYRGYNREMGSYARNVMDREPDDLIDERILNRDADDYDYDKSR